MEQRKEQKKEQRVYAAFGRGARRDWKRAARKTVFSHYWMAIMVCLVAAFLGTEFTGSLESLHFTRQKWDVISNFLASFGRPGAAANSRGVFAIAVNKIADGSLQNIVNNTIMSLAGSSEFWQSFGIVVSSLVSMTYWVLVTHTFVVILRRLFMEMRVYEEVPPYRALYLHSARCWGRTSLALLRVAVQRGLWWLTIIGGAIKTFSYYLCGFILAENPTMKGGDAIALSRKMMNGHKWECFLLELSFVPWHLLSLATFGLSSLFYSSAYLSAARCEFYAAVRAQVKAEGEAQALRDFRIAMAIADQLQNFAFARGERIQVAARYLRATNLRQLFHHGAAEPGGILHHRLDGIDQFGFAALALGDVLDDEQGAGLVLNHHRFG